MTAGDWKRSCHMKILCLTFFTLSTKKRSELIKTFQSLESMFWKNVIYNITIKLMTNTVIILRADENQGVPLDRRALRFIFLNYILIVKSARDYLKLKHTLVRFHTRTHEHTNTYTHRATLVLVEISALCPGLLHASNHPALHTQASS